MIDTKEFVNILGLVRIGLGISEPQNYRLPESLDWEQIITFSRRQGVVGVMADGLSAISLENMPERKFIVRIMGSAGKYEKKYDEKVFAVSPLANVWHKSGIRIALLKGMAFARYYPNPKHRYSSDVDVFLSEAIKDTEERKCAFDKGNEIARKYRLYVNSEIQKHAQICIKGVTIENHCKCCGQLEHRPMAMLEDYLEKMLLNGECTLCEGSHYELPPLMFDAVFYIYHSRVHFVIEEGILLRHVMDWVMIRREVARNGKIGEVEALCKKFGMRKFLEAIDGVADYVEGKVKRELLSVPQQLMLENILNAPAPKKKTEEGRRSMFARRLGMLIDIYNSRWKYPLYSDVSFAGMMWIYVKGHIRRIVSLINNKKV